MFKRLLVLAIGIIFFILLTPKALAEGEFLTSYKVTYDVGADGVTTVNEKVTLKNTTDKYYASSFSFSIGSTKISDILASDSKGNLATDVQTESGRTKIDVKFNEQVVGKDKEYSWNLRFKSRDFAQAQGRVWQVTIPRAPTLSEFEDYNLTLSVPVSFGDPTTIVPTPVKQTESGGKINLIFNKDQIKESGILANFGSEQLFDFKINYELKNTNLLPSIAKLPLPPDTNYQEVLINNISPKPENVTTDADGNFIAWFKVARDESVDVTIEGLAKLLINPKTSEKLLDSDVFSLIQPDQYWEVNNPIMKTRLSEIFKDGTPEMNREKAMLINKFVANYLKYDESRVETEDFQRYGALTALNNPEKSLCGEYTDLFITLLRSVGVPARRLEGYAYTSNTDIRPLSLGQTLLHAWPEYYDEKKDAWVMVDPTWESTNDGVDYFSKFDLNHFVISILGRSSDEPSVGGKVEVKFSDAKFEPRNEYKIVLNAPEEVLAGLPVKVAMSVLNQGNKALESDSVNLFSKKGNLIETRFSTSTLPPFGNLEYETNLSPANFWQYSEDEISVGYKDQVITKGVVIRPFYQYPNFLVGVLGLAVFMISIYVLVLVLHYRKYGKILNVRADIAAKRSSIRKK